MVDVLTSRQRSYCMSRIRGKDTAPETVVRRAAFALGYRFRLHSRDLPGTPDLVFPSRRRVIFVHGCFWHGHRCRYGRHLPKTNTDFWAAKRSANNRRDRRAKRALWAEGWKVLTIWGCQLRDDSRLRERIDRFLCPRGGYGTKSRSASGRPPGEPVKRPAS